MKRFILTVSVMLAMVFSCFAANPESDFIYDMAPDGEGVMIKQYKGTSTTVVFPDTIEGLPVTQIGSNDILDYTLFPNKDKRYNITVPKSVKVIGGTAFLGVKGKINMKIITFVCSLININNWKLFTIFKRNYSVSVCAKVPTLIYIIPKTEK